MLSLHNLHEYGSAVIGTSDLYDAWLNTPNQEFGGIAPKELMYDGDGIIMIIDQLYKIQKKKASKYKVMM